MRGSRRWSAEEKELERTNPIFRAAPGEVLAEREAAWAAELTPNMVVLVTHSPGVQHWTRVSHVSALSLYRHYAHYR